MSGNGMTARRSALFAVTRILHHAPAGRRPDHARVYLGDKRTWYRVVKNTVPVDLSGQSRSWAPPAGNGGRGRVD